MNGILIGYARVSTAGQDLTSKRTALLRLGVLDSNIYVDHGLTGTNRAGPGLREALAAVREGDTLVVTKVDRHAAQDELTLRFVSLCSLNDRGLLPSREAPKVWSKRKGPEIRVIPRLSSPSL
jgi:DNA invertase Pin-like site-specific DNA recombinase